MRRLVRDLTEAQFKAACRRNGWLYDGFLGYYRLAHPCDNACVSIYNAPRSTRRSALAFLHAEQERHERGSS